MHTKSERLNAQVFFLTNVKVAALNNAGKSTASRNDNGIATKKVWMDGNPYPFMSAQSYGYAQKTSLQKIFNWDLALLLRNEKTVTMVANPFLYPDADLYGYLNAEKSFDVDESTGEIKKDSKNKEKMVDTTVNRKGPLNKRSLRSVGPVSIFKEFSVLSRQEGAPVPYTKEVYGGCLEGGICIDCFSVGTFSDYNKTGYKNITSKMKEQYLENGCFTLDDPYEKNEKGLPQQLVRMPREIRIKRITDVIQIGRFISGGAMQANNMEDITYDFAIFYSTSSGNHLFGNIMSERALAHKEEISEEGEDKEKLVQRIIINKSKIILNVDAILEELWDYRTQIKGTVFIGKRAGFLDEFNEGLKNLIIFSGKARDITLPDGNIIIEHYPIIELGSVGDMADRYCAQLENQII